MIIHGINKTTLLDYPEHIACTIFTGHCNFRCPFCHNGELVLCPDTQPVIPEADFFDFLTKRGKRLEGVAITGGEPTLQPDLIEFIGKIKERGLLVKLDTNGTRPDLIKELINNSLVDYFAIDIKSSKESYNKVCGIPDMDISKIEESVDLLMTHPIPYEFRTTVCKELHNESEFRKIAEWIKGCRAYYLQSYIPSDTLLVDMMPDNFKSLYPNGFSSYKPEELKEFNNLLISLGINSHLRGIE